MLVIERFKRFVNLFIVVVLVFSLIPVGIFAQTFPWTPYSKYIPDKAPVVKRELRGAWVCTVLNMDWPSLDTIKIQNDAERINKSKEELVAVLDKAVEHNMNAVFFQVSPEGDALYKSDIVPWSRYLTGTFGKDPGFDPLAFAIEEARKRNLEIHAWFNPYRVSMDVKDTTVSSLNVEKSVYKEHPELIKTSMSRFIVDPGIPESRKWVTDRVMEVVNNYDIDGVHFDDYFYYENKEGEMKDESTFNKYNNGQFSNLGDFRRNNTYLLVKELSEKIRSTKSWVKFGISPAGVWGNKSDGHPDGSNTKSSFTNYERSFADTKRWVEEELVDYIAPQVYFSFANSRAGYGEVVSWWSQVCSNKKVHLYIGQPFYKINDDTDTYFKGVNAVPELSRQLKFNAAKPGVMGSIMFRIQNFNDSGKKQAASAIKNDLWAKKTLVPLMPWKGGTAPETPVKGSLTQTMYGLELSWEDNDPNTAYYAVYRFNKGDVPDIVSDNAANYLLGTLRKYNNGKQTFSDYSTSNPDGVVYVITALDRLHNESAGLTISLTVSEYFNDIGREYSWAKEAIDTLYEKGIVKGVGEGTFNPFRNTKRGDFVLMMGNALELKADFLINFNDVTKTSYYYEAIGTARALGIISGTGENLFVPDGYVTREDIMVIVNNAAEKSGIMLETAEEGYLGRYSDAKQISSYAAESVAKLTKSGIIQGAEGKVNPKQLATRAEIAVIVNKLLNFTVNQDKTLQ
ncbi:MAG: family 10 glycosylhydrolase [Clostridiaceae bacterium]|nr:family 10 glycosylhydrolase [Clostridiaceae bacterium]